jgi:hypothetical protein
MKQFRVSVVSFDYFPSTKEFSIDFIASSQEMDDVEKYTIKIPYNCEDSALFLQKFRILATAMIKDDHMMKSTVNRLKNFTYTELFDVSEQ